MVYTLFSAPNYCGSYGNLGAILTIVVTICWYRIHSSTLGNTNKRILNTTCQFDIMPLTLACHICLDF